MTSLRPQRLRRTLLFCLLAGVPGLGSPVSASAACSTAATAASSSATLPQATRALRCLVNAERRQHGLRPVRSSRPLQRAAARHSKAMLAGGAFDHRVSGEAPLDRRVLQTGYLRGARQWWLGEAIAYGAADRSSPAALMRSLMASPVHRAIILNPRFRELGVGLLSGLPEPGGAGRGGATLTLDFGRVRTR